MKIKANTSGLDIDITASDEEFASKISKHNLFGMIGDQIASWRFKNAIKVLRKTERLAKEEGVPISLIPSKFLQQFVEAASLEDDENLQDMWANLLVSKSSDANSANILYINILKSLEPIEALFLQMVYQQAGNSTDTTFNLVRIMADIELNETELRVIVHKMYSFGVLRPPYFRGITSGDYNHSPAIETTDLFRFSDLGLDFCKKCNVGSAI